MTHEQLQNEQAVRVLIVDDQRIICEGIAALLRVQPGIAVIGTAASGQEAIEQAEQLQPDVVLMDIRMPGMDGITATAELLRRIRGCQVLMLTTFDDDAYIRDALRVGAVGYLLKDIPARNLAHAIQAAHKRIYQFDQTIAGKVVAALQGAGALSNQPTPTEQLAASTTGKAIAHELTKREFEVLRLIARGASNREIAEGLVISEGTVKSHISHILSRLGLRDRTQAALYARDQGWV